MAKSKKTKSRGESKHVRQIKDIEERIKSVDDASPYAKILAYARNKQGKTVFGAGAPRAFIIDIAEEGTRSAAGSGAMVVEVKTFDEVVHAYWYLKAGKHKYKTAVIDTITALYEAAMRKVLGDAEEHDPSREPAARRRQDWGRANQLVNNLLLDFRNLPMHVIFLAQERVIEDEEEEEPALHTVSLTAGTRGVALGCVGVVGRIYLKEVKVKGKKKTKWEARMLVGPHEQYDTGNRIGLPRIIRADAKRIIKQWEINPPQEEE